MKERRSGCQPSHVMTNEAERSRIQDRAQVPEVGWILGYRLWSRERRLGPSVGDVCVFVCFEMWSHYATQDGLSSQPSCPSLLNAEITDVCHCGGCS